MVKVKVITEFTDQLNGFIRRPVNETFECTRDRAESLINRGLVVELINFKEKEGKEHEQINCQINRDY